MLFIEVNKGGLLRLQELVERIRRYAELRSSVIIPGPTGEKGLRAGADRMLQEILVILF